MTPDLINWLQRWNLPAQALNELLILTVPVNKTAKPGTEAAAVNDIRLEASNSGCLLMRNNKGVAFDKKGVPIRFGLANDTKAMSDEKKSSDLIGIKPVFITPQHVGHVLGVFLSIEAKHGAWQWSGNDHEIAQASFHTTIKSYGGISFFARSKEDFRQCMNY